MLKNYSSALLFVFISGISFSQTISVSEVKNVDPFTNPVILKHYSVNELQQIQATDSIKFNTIVYYYTQSFIVEKVDCPTCSAVDLNKFDVSKYEYLRKQNVRYVRDAEKYGIKLTLLSIDELVYKLPIHNQ